MSTPEAIEPSLAANTAPGTSTSTGLEKPFVGTFQSSGNVILGTAIIHVRNNIGDWTPVRALLDTGSQISVITHACASRLGLKRRSCNTSVMGLSQAHVPATKGSTHLTFRPRHADNPKISCDPLILSKITGPMPASKLSPDIRNTYNHVELADPEFDNPAPIEFLLGADVYVNILGDCVRVLHARGFPSAFETSLGWVIIGHTTITDSSPCVSLLLSTQPSIDHLMHQFWSIEEPSPPVEPFTDDQKCEEHFTQTSSRDDQGRFSLALPFKSNPSILGDSYKMATSRFYNLEHKLQRDPDLYALYRDFMKEYEALGHMVISEQPGKYYIPHHAVVKRNGTNIKLRVVFDASAASTSKCSLNDLLYTGPKLQSDITQILHRCRLRRYMFTADICKMYRQIQIHSDDRTYQHIVWRNSPSDELQDYELTTVTYGVSASPYQAIRVLHQLEHDDGHKFPLARKILSTQTYVDDIVSGDDTVSALLQRQADLVQLLMQAGFELKKWSSNTPEVLRHIPQGDHAVQPSFDPKDDMSVKILGLHWDPVTDTFSYHTSPVPLTVTKRVVLSTIAKLYDPVGAIAPIIFWAKSLMQTIWQSGLDWDDPLPPSLMTSWEKFASELHLVCEIKLPRHIVVSTRLVTQLLGFCDASERGYAAVVYLRTIDVNGEIKVYFITSKSKVAPLKLGSVDRSLTIPRLELCGALLLAQTIQRLCDTFEGAISISAIYTWTDSQVVLSWLTSTQSHFKIFVTNRLAKINALMPSCRWRYIPSALNPADCVSRGLLPSETVNHPLYWQGPPFLHLIESDWPSETCELIPPSRLPDYKSIDAVTCSVTSLPPPAWYLRFSSLTRMQRVTAYVQRFIKRTRLLTTSTGPLQHSELEHALVPIIIATQQTCFAALVSQLNGEDPKISPRSMAQLAPFTDQIGIIRVGGRLTHARSTVVAKCPILLPKVSHLTTLVIRHYHLTYLHAGPQLIASLLARTYWVISGRSAIRQLVFNCVVCARHNPRVPQPFMGNLPAQRVRQSRPFSHVGIDFAGPLLIKDGRRRNAPSVKCYLAVFVCMSIKAIHVEVVSDLSTNAFIASLHRFVSRRGVPSDIYSDCGTNFIGADRELQKLFGLSATQNSVSDSIPCRWHFNPPAAPHFGGLWEAAVKSVKFHLKRVVGTQILTFEELTTLASRIEAVLNSRPLTAMSSDPHDLRALSPGDFLIGQPLTALPEPDQTYIAQNRLNRWELLRQIYQSFWKRWASEYLTTLQGRSKWVQHQPNVKVGDLVLIQTPNQPPMFWKLGRIENTHPGQDGVVRVATVRTNDGCIKRPVVKLAVLPMEGNSST